MFENEEQWVEMMESSGCGLKEVYGFLFSKFKRVPGQKTFVSSVRLSVIIALHFLAKQCNPSCFLGYAFSIHFRRKIANKANKMEKPHKNSLTHLTSLISFATRKILHAYGGPFKIFLLDGALFLK